MICIEALVGVATVIFLGLGRKTGNIPDVIVATFPATTRHTDPRKSEKQG